MQYSIEAERYLSFKSLSPIFIGGMPRSGTSLLQALLNGHPQLLVYEFEDCLIREFIHPSKTHAGIADTQKGMLARDAEQIFSSLLKSPKCSVPLLPQIEYRGKSVQTNIDVHYFKRCFIETLSSVSGRWNIYEVLMAWMFSYFRSLGIEDMSPFRGWVTKCPDRGRCLAVYNSAFPDCRIIQLVRDPRAFYASYALAEIGHASGLKPLNGSLARRSLISRINQLMYLADEYKISCSSVRAAQGDGKQNLLVVRYEDLVKNAGNTMRSVSDFLGIDFHDVLTRPTFRNQPWTANSSFVFGEESDGRIFDSSLDRWKRLLRWYERILIESRLSDELIEFGYAKKVQFQKLKKFIWFILQYRRGM